MFTTYAMTKILNGIFQGAGTTNPATLYFGGFPVAPTRSGGGTESGYVNYLRQGVTANLTNFPAATGTLTVLTTNAGAILFPSAGAGTSENWQATAHFDAASGGNMWAYYSIPSNPALVPGTIIQIGVGELSGQIALSPSGGFTTYAASQILACIYSKKAVVPPGITNFYFAGFTSNPTVAGGGNESLAAGYVRLVIPIAAASWSAASGANPVSCANLNPLTFPLLTGNEKWVGWALYDAATPGTGNMWAFGLLQTPISIVPGGSQPSFPVGSIQPIMTGTT